MPLKKRAMRGKGKAAARNEKIPVVDKFESELARNMFNDFTTRRNLWPERGFVYMSSDTLGYPEYIYSVIFKNNWKNIYQHPSVAIVPLVKEFYANIDGGSPNSVYVRGKRVDISGSAINKVYRLDDVEDEYFEFSKRVHENQLSEIVKEICVLGTESIKSAHESIFLSRRNLKPGPMIWNHFLNELSDESSERLISIASHGPPYQISTLLRLMNLPLHKYNTLNLCLTSPIMTITLRVVLATHEIYDS
ncbi:hypothetical protein TIFTF001_029734 [Ficus carica]|uniref:Putative plant transposon protein domain-containing protein n=1 Tax=Ficus carica TaxID=3494 RepID=A0AA88DS39_FICCA|nr:hypothetical protein TIFTF001_029734 [Ficus carica]